MSENARRKIVFVIEVVQQIVYNSVHPESFYKFRRARVASRQNVTEVMERCFRFAGCRGFLLVRLIALDYNPFFALGKL